MDEKRTRHGRRWRELIDAVRPASDDLARADFAELAVRLSDDPQLRKVYERSQQFDAAIADALHDLPVPVGSVDRLLATLAAAERDRRAASSAADAARAVERDAAPSTARAAEVPRPSPGARFRRFSASALLTATVGVALVAYFIFRPAQLELTADEIVSSDWSFADEPAGENRLISEKKSPAKYPCAAALAAKPTSWRPIAGLLGRSQGVAYHLQSGAARATLYVVDHDPGYAAPRFVGLPAAPPPNPNVTTGGRAKSVWREGGLVYVLVVEGGAAEYRAFVTPTGQLACGEQRSAFDSCEFKRRDPRPAPTAESS